MLIIIFVSYIFSIMGGSSDILLGEWLIKESPNQFKVVIQDKERSKQAMKVVNVMIKEAKKFNSEAGKDEKKLEKLVLDYNSTPEDFNQLFSSIQARREASSAKILEMFPDLKKSITREEWVKSFEDVKLK